MTPNVVPLDEVAEVKLGRQRSPQHHTGDFMRPYVRAANVGWDGFALDDVKSMNFTEREMETYRLQVGDILLGEASGSAREVGKPAIWEGQIDDCAFQNTLIRVRPVEGRARPRYLLHYFKYLAGSGKFAASSRGVGIFHLGRKALASWPVPIPPIDEQQRVAAVLDAANALRDKRRQALTTLDSLNQAIFIDMFGDPASGAAAWPVVRIGDVLDAASYGTSKKAGATGNVPVLRMGNLDTAGRIHYGDLKYVDLDEREEPKHLVRPGDVLFNRTNSADLVGKTAVFRGSAPMAYAGYLIRLRPGDQLDSDYLGAFMNMPSTKQLLRAMCKSIVGMANINAKEVQSIKMPLPPIDAQKQYARVVAQVEDRRSDISRQTEHLHALFCSLQQRAFRGEL